MWSCLENDVHMRSACVRLAEQQFKVTFPEFYLKFNCVTRKSVLPRRKHSVYMTKTNLLTSFRETMSLCCIIHVKYTNALCGQNAGFPSVNCWWYTQLPLRFKGLMACCSRTLLLHIQDIASSHHSTVQLVTTNSAIK